MTDDLIALARRSMDAWNAHDLESYLALWHPEAEYVAPRRTVRGIDEIRAYMTMLMDAFPDEHADVDHAARTGDTVLVRYTDTGTHTGPLRWRPGRTLEPTGRPFRFDGVTELRYQDGLIIRGQEYLDLFDFLFVQLGVPFPAPRTAG